MGSTTIEENGHDASGSHATSPVAATPRRSGIDATQPVKPFGRRTDYNPDDLVQVRIRAETRDRFDAWYASQHPGLRQLPDRAPWMDEVFRLGLEQIEELMPAVLSPAERLEQARKERGQ